MSLMNRQKAHTEGKCLLKYDNIDWGWTIWERKKEGVKQKGKGPTKRFSYGLRSPKPQDQEIEKFLPHPISKGFVKRGEEEEADTVFFTLR